MTDVIIREVGLRDGLQLVKTPVETVIKQRWIDAAAAAGIVQMEVTSFVPPARLPIFADAEAVLAHALGAGIQPTVLAPNFKGALRALDAGATKITFIVTASEAFSQSNLRRPIRTSQAELDQLLNLRSASYPGAKITLGVSSAFGCTIEGAVSSERVRAITTAGAAAGVDEIVLADTVGYAQPLQVRALTRLVAADLPNMPLGIHLHDTRGTGLANALAAYDAGIRLFESSWAGLGGCPNSPLATGNIATEDLVYMFEAMGVDTGIRVAPLLAIVEDVLGEIGAAPWHSHLRSAGLPTGFATAADRKGARQ